MIRDEEMLKEIAMKTAEEFNRLNASWLTRLKEVNPNSSGIELSLAALSATVVGMMAEIKYQAWERNQQPKKED